MVRYRNLKFMGYPKYRVGDDGSVWSRQTGVWKQMKYYVGNRGTTCIVGLQRNLKSKGFPLSNLILSAFVGPRPEGMEARHFPDRDITNNRLDNLSWGTRTENGEDRRFHRTGLYGELDTLDRFVAKLTRRKITLIQRLVRAGVPISQVAEMYRVSASWLSKLLTRETS